MISSSRPNDIASSSLRLISQVTFVISQPLVEWKKHQKCKHFSRRPLLSVCDFWCNSVSPFLTPSYLSHMSGIYGRYASHHIGVIIAQIPRSVNYNSTRCCHCPEVLVDYWFTNQVYVDLDQMTTRPKKIKQSKAGNRFTVAQSWLTRNSI